MRASSLVVLLVVAAVALCCVSGVDARNSYVASNWESSSSLSSSAVSGDTLHRVNLALRQRNVEQLHALVARVSDPEHVQYGRYRSLDDLASLLAPSDADLVELESVLLAAGALEVDLVASRDFVSVLLPVSAIQKLWSAPDGKQLELRVHRHVHSGRQLLRINDGGSFVPRAEQFPVLERVVELVSGLSDFMDYPRERKLARQAATDKARRKAFAAKAAFETVALESSSSAAPVSSDAARRHSRIALFSGKSAAKLSPFVQSCTSSAPDFGRLKGSHEDVAVTVVPYCKNGQPTKDHVNLCSDFPPQIIGFQLALLPRAHSDMHVSLDRSQVVCENKPDGSAVTCVFPIQDFPAWGRMDIQVQSLFADKTFSVPASYGAGFTPSPYITPNAIFERYSVPLGTKGSGSRYGNSQCVVAFEEQYIDVAGDLRPFAQQLGFPLFQTPTIDGQNDPTNPGMESTLDISYIMGVGQNVPTTFMSLTGQGPAKPPGDGAYILEWAMHISNLTSPPLVTSVSYGDTEDGYYTKFGSYVYIDRMEVELAKMAARGLTVLAGSGDAGVSNVGEEGNDISDTDPTCAPFRPFYPSNSPYVTSVSSTFLSTNYLPVCQTNLPVGNSQSLPIVCHQVGEIAVGVSQGMAWTTGGGFSNRSASNPRAPWQRDVVEAYLATSNLPQPSSLYNAKGRGYPDVATLGHNLLMMFNGGLVTVDGTSASGPVMAGLVSLLNDVRLKARKAPLGLLNPFLYAAARDQPASFMDVTVGTNADGDVQPKCSPYPSTCPAGFETGPGWNAVTGLGTPNWTVLRDHALAIVADNYVRTKSD